MVNVIKDERIWEVTDTYLNDDCDHLFYPANYHGCRLLDEDHNKCTYENCPLPKYMIDKP